MNCQEYKDMIEDALDISLQGELKASIRRHLDHCQECRDYLAMRRQEHAALFSGVNAAFSHLRKPPDDFADRILREVEARRTVRRGWRRFSLPRWALIAASLAVMAGFVFAATIAIEAVLTDDEIVAREEPKEVVGSSADCAAAPLAAASGDGYQFVNPDTYPAANLSHSAPSSAITLETGALRVAGVANDLEARSRTRLASVAIALVSTKFQALIISIR